MASPSVNGHVTNTLLPELAHVPSLGTESGGDVAFAKGATSVDPATEIAQTGTMEPLEIVAAPNDEIVYPTGTKFAVVAMALGLTLVITGLDFSILATAIPTITQEFKTTADIGWYVAAFRLSFASVQFLFVNFERPLQPSSVLSILQGKLYQNFSLKIVFLVCCVIFELGSLICATAPSSTAFVIGRAVCGAGASGIIQGIFAIAVLSVSVRDRGLYGGIAAGVEAIALSTGPVIGGAITQSAGWRWCFYMNLPIGAVTIILIIAFFDLPQRNPNVDLPWKEKIKRLDLVGTTLFIPSITSLLLALQYGGTKYSWNNPRIIVLFIVFGTLLGMFAWLQYKKQDEATIPPRIFFLNNAAMNLIDYYLPLYFQTVKQVSVARSGVLSLPITVGLGISLFIGGAGTTLSGYYTPFMIVTSVLAPIAAGLLTTIKVDAKLANLLGYQALLGFGSGIGFQGPQVAVQTILAPNDVPIGIAIIQFAQALGPALSVPIGQLIYTTQLTTNLKKYAPAVNGTTLENIGLLNIGSQFQGSELAGILRSYDKAITYTFYLSVVLTCLTLVGSVGIGWRSVKQKQT
ncbi:hypothetical protein BP6252_05428 [Coleophoma cylindrospora]|uniref:Major facilitator superfamily (MFS) profile domain-containing protein n=1 Tax=Coleophoma cylindrospora TaxID=1849047 RepID=A0A3D8RTN9_9HELO|nr:hypothetical protein BP6252_05428 [Coleophoma cylindrospora]